MAHLGFFLCVLASLVSSSLAQKCYVSVSGIILVDHVLSSFRDENIHECYEKCKEKIGCMSINFYRDSFMCELNNRTITAKPSKKRDNSMGVYFEKPTPAAIGSHEELPGESCMEIKTWNRTYSPSSGVYWIKHAHQSKQAYCNMSTGVADPCRILPCKNQGTCQKLDEVTYKCTCVVPFYGKNCQTKVQSNILQNRAQYVQLSEWLATVPGKPTRWETCYHSTNDGWAASTFHTKCDGVGPTITIIKVKQYIFGGYTDASWDYNGGWIKSANSFIFSFVNRDSLKPFKTDVYHTSNAIYGHTRYLPTFGHGHDIRLNDNAGNNMHSYTNFGYSYPLQGYPRGSSQARNLLAGSYKFQPDQVQVFKQVGG